MGYVLGSHNSWSYLQPKKWWMRLIGWTAKCQSLDIQQQYMKGVRCFDLRIRTDADGKIVLAHGIVEYKDYLFLNDLTFLDNKGDVMVRVLHETKRWGNGCSEQEKARFAEKCGLLQKMFPGIKFYGGQDVRTWVRYFDFGTDAPTEDGCYASNMKPRVIDDWWPWLFARLNNRKFRERGTNLDVLVLDFVEIGGEDGARSPAQ